MYVCKDMSFIKMSSWWIYVQQFPCEMKKCVTIIKLMIGVHKLNSVLYKHKTCNLPNSLCNLCTSYEEESVSHLLFRCSNFHQKRKKLWKDVEETCPSQILLDTINSMNDNNKCTFLLTGLNNSYVCEWTMFYHSIAKFINTMYQVRLSSDLDYKPMMSAGWSQ